MGQVAASISGYPFIHGKNSIPKKIVQMKKLKKQKLHIDKMVVAQLSTTTLKNINGGLIIKKPIDFGTCITTCNPTKDIICQAETIDTLIP